jgi:murein DD-endopeptidase MepM/ murein hydrolase activator NlpD
MADRHSRRPRRLATLAALACVALGGVGAPAGTRADSVSDAQSKVSNAQHQLNNSQGVAGKTAGVIAGLEAQLAQYGDRETQLRAVVAELNRQVDAQVAQVAAAQQELNRIQSDLDAAQAHLADARQRLAADRAQLAAAVKQIYENPPTTTINALLSSDTFDELYQKYVDERRVAASEQQLADTVNTEAAQVERDVAQISADRQRQGTVLAAQQAAATQLEQTRAVQQEAQRELDAVIAADQQALAQNQAAQVEIQAEIAQEQRALASDKQALAAAQAAAAAAARRHSSSGGGLSGYGGTGRFGWPEPPDAISQGFGCTPYPYEPYDPSCPSRHFHTGIDIADPWGTPVEAADNGVVHIFVSSYGYGLHIIMAHGNDFFTVYGHLSSFAVSDGTYVSRGTVIGYEGSTGNSSGPHLHFEIREGQTPVDPLAFLS